MTSERNTAERATHNVCTGEVIQRADDSWGVYHATIAEGWLSIASSYSPNCHSFFVRADDYDGVVFVYRDAIDSGVFVLGDLIAESEASLLDLSQPVGVVGHFRMPPVIFDAFSVHVYNFWYQTSRTPDIRGGVVSSRLDGSR